MTDYIAPLHIALVRHGSLIGNRDVAFIAAALALQGEDIAAAWGIAPPGCQAYDVGSVPDVDRVAQLHLVPTDGDDGALGSHTKVGDSVVGDVDLAQSGPDVAAVCSHEFAEMVINADLDQWVPAPDGLLWAREIGDPVEAQSYPVDVEVMNEKRTLLVSNYVYPAFFGLRNADGHEGYDRMLELTAPFQIAPGGYAIASDADGNIRYLAAEGGAMFPARKLKATSRTARIISKGRR